MCVGDWNITCYNLCMCVRKSEGRRAFISVKPRHAQAPVLWNQFYTHTESHTHSLTHIRTEVRSVLIQHHCLLGTPWWEERRRDSRRLSVFSSGLYYPSHTLTRTQLFTLFLSLTHTHKSIPVEWLSDCFLPITLSPAEKQTVHLSGYRIAKAEMDFTYNSHVHLVHFTTVYLQKQCLSFSDWTFFLMHCRAETVSKLISREAKVHEWYSQQGLGGFCSSDELLVQNNVVKHKKT